MDDNGNPEEGVVTAAPDVPEATDAPDAPPLDRDLTIYHVADLKPRLLAWADAGCAPLSLGAVAECDSAGVQLLLAARRSLAARGSSLQITAASAVVRDALSVFGLQALLPTTP